jgi:CHAD domain-containing protein
MSAGPVQQAKVEVSIGYEQRADAAAAAVLRRLLEVICDNLEGALAGADIEYLHQLRVAVRRSRTVQRQFHGVFPGVELPGYRSDFRWLQRATGPARDLDVYVDEFEELRALLPVALRADLDPLALVLARRQLTARAGLAATLRSPRLQALAADWEQLLESLVELPLEDRPTARRSIGSLTGERVAAVYDRIVAMGSRIDDSSPAERYHELRKKGKELRYLLELFGARVFAAEDVDPLVRSLKGMQDVLGRHQDREVQTAMVRALAAEVAPLPGGGAACLAMGVLVDRLAEDAHAARAEFAERFATLAAEPQRTRIAETFRSRAPAAPRAG